MSAGQHGPRPSGQLLAEKLAQVAPELATRALPFLDAADLRKQRDEYRQRNEVAQAFAADQTAEHCKCGTARSLPPYIIDVECEWHYLLRVLCGDLA